MHNFSYVYFYSLHVSCSQVPIIRRIIVSMWHLVYFTLSRWPSGMQEHMLLYTRLSSTQSDINQVSHWYSSSPDDVHMAARNMYRKEINIHEKLCIKLVIYKDHPSKCCLCLEQSVNHEESHFPVISQLLNNSSLSLSLSLSLSQFRISALSQTPKTVSNYNPRVTVFVFEAETFPRNGSVTFRYLSRTFQFRCRFYHLWTPPGPVPSLSRSERTNPTVFWCTAVAPVPHT